MSNSNFNGFPTDGSYGSQIKYDLFVKHMNAAISSANASKSGNAGFIGMVLAIFQILLIIILTALLLLGKIINFIINLFLSRRNKKREKLMALERQKYIDEICSGLEADD